MAYVVTLTASDIDFGRQLAAALKQQKFQYQGMFWLFDDSSDDWKLVIVTALVDKLGPRGTYLQLSRVTKSIEAADLQLLRCTVWSPQSPTYRALQSVFGPAASVEGARLHHTMVNGLHIADAYLYEIN